MRVFLIFITVLLNCPIVLADIEQDAHQLNFEIMSPFCPGRSLADCPTEAADGLRNEIRTQLEMGSDKQVVMESVIKKYGEQFRAAPKKEGFGILAYLVPLLIFLLGGFFILRFIIFSKSEKS